MTIPIVDEQDNILCYKDANDRDPGKEFTRVSVLWLYNEVGEFLISKRSKEKRYHPGLWSLSVSGTHEEGETYESNIIKETMEELGVALKEMKLGPKEMISTEGRGFFAQYFFAKIPKNTVFTLQKSEVDEVRWVSLSELKKWFARNPKEFSSHFSLHVLEAYEFKS